MTAASDPAAVVRRWVEGTWNEPDADRRASALHALHPSSFQNEGAPATPDDMVAWHVRTREAFPDLRYEIDELLVVDDRAILRWTAQATHRGTLWGLLPATGRPVTWRGIHLLTVREGLISEVWAAAEWVEVLAQLNAQLLPGTDAEPG